MFYKLSHHVVAKRLASFALAGAALVLLTTLPWPTLTAAVSTVSMKNMLPTPAVAPPQSVSVLPVNIREQLRAPLPRPPQP